jgi:hypothetical protein
MTAHEPNGPPENDEGGALTSPADVEVDSHTTNATDVTAIAVQLRRRRAASYRLPVLDSGRADPWYYDRPEPSERTVEGYCAAATHLLALGLVPAPDLDAMRLMWRRDVEQRRLAQYIAERWEVAA